MGPDEKSSNSGNGRNEDRDSDSFSKEGLTMGIGCRVFLVDDNDSLQRISTERLNRLLYFHRKESLPQYAGKRVRCAMVFVEVAGRQVLSIRNADYFLLTFDDKGRIDKKE